jgi:hypothetical protein
MAQQSDNNPVNVAKQLVAATEQGMKNILPGAPEAVAEKPALLRRIPEYQTLENRINVLWKPAVMNLATVAPTEASQTILIQACGSLTPANYVKFLNQMATLYEQGRIPKILLTRAIYPNGKLRYILHDNYQNKDVIAFCQRAKKIWSNEPQTAKMFDAILSGEAKRGTDDMRKGGVEASTEVKIAPSAQASPQGTGTAGQ